MDIHYTFFYSTYGKNRKFAVSHLIIRADPWSPWCTPICTGISSDNSTVLFIFVLVLSHNNIPHYSHVFLLLSTYISKSRLSAVGTLSNAICRSMRTKNTSFSFFLWTSIKKKKKIHAYLSRWFDKGWIHIGQFCSSHW